MRTLTIFGVCVVLLGLHSKVFGGVPQDPMFAESDYAILGDITRLAWAPDGTNRLFVTTKAGTVRIVKDGTLLAAPFATESVIT